MAENKKNTENTAERKPMCLTMTGKQLLAMGDCTSRDESRHILTGIRIEGDYEGRWNMAATDSFKLFTMSNGTCAKEFAFTLPPAALSGVKVSDTVYLEYDEDKDEIRVTRHMARGKGMAESTVKPLSGKYPDYERILVDDCSIPRACYRDAMFISTTYLADVLKAIEKACGKDNEVVVAMPESEPKKQEPIMVYAEGKGSFVRAVVMPHRIGVKENGLFLGKPHPFGKDAKAMAELRKERDAAQANADMWRGKYTEYEKKCAECEKNDSKEERGATEKAAKLERDLAKAIENTQKWKEACIEQEKLNAELNENLIAAQEKAETENKEESMDYIKRIEELEAELKARNAELERVWKENEGLKAAKAEQPAESTVDAATVVSLEIILAEAREWCKHHPNTTAFRKKGDKAPVRISGVMSEDAELQAELIEMGYRWAKGPQVWMYDVYSAENKRGLTVIDGR